MSIALFVVAEREVDGVRPDVDGKALGRCNQLDRLAKQAGVRPLMEYFSQDPAEAEALLEGEDAPLPPGGLPREQWFSADDGLVTVRGLLAQLAANPRSVPNAPAVVADLQGFEAALLALAGAGSRWHLAVDF
jgi:hypothetical protein